MPTAKLYPNRVLNPIDRKILGHFVEQFPGNIPQGIFDPTHPLADEDGFRTDLLQAMRDTKVSQLRWAGNFSSNYHWMDGIGPVEERPKKVNFAWNAVEDNRHGTAEFVKLCRKVGALPVIGINMGSASPEEAMNWVEYCNGTDDTYYANLRRSHGYKEPFEVKHWCLGNEMYASWQFGYQDKETYAKSAEHFALAMKRADSSILLTAVGLETDSDWNETVARRLMRKKTRYTPGEYIDYLSAHYYPIGCAGAFERTDYQTRMALSAFFHERTMLIRNAIELAADDTHAPVGIAWDEWNPMGDRDGSEFTLEMAIWSATILNSFIRDSKYVKMANYTFFIGGNGPVQTDACGVVYHAEYHLFKLYGELLGESLIDLTHNSRTVTVQMPSDRRWPKPGMPESRPREIPLLDMAATIHSDGRLCLFVVNMDSEKEETLHVKLMECERVYQKVRLHTLWHENLRARNNLEAPDTIKACHVLAAAADNTVSVSLPRHAICALEIW